MRVFVVGASGAIGTRLVRQLIERVNEVIGSSTSSASAERVRQLGAKPVILDLLDPRAVRKSVLGAAPDAIVHEVTALANAKFTRNLDKSFVATNRLRTEGTDALIAAGREAGVSRYVAQSFASYRYLQGEPVETHPPATMRESSDAMAYLERAVTDVGGITLRYGVFYGAANDGLIEPV